MNIDEFIEHTQETARKHRYHADFFDIDNPMRVACIKSAEDCEQLAEWLEKSKEYQQLEEQGRLIKLPCKVGDIVYIAETVLVEAMCIRIQLDGDRNGIWINAKEYPCDRRISFKAFGKTVFLTKSEAEERLKELRGEENEERS
jgi:hypothetical protein